ncbi:hypothetical protein Bca101_006754 [Brassica carinata]
MDRLKLSRNGLQGEAEVAEEKREDEVVEEARRDTRLQLRVVNLAQKNYRANLLWQRTHYKTMHKEMQRSKDLNSELPEILPGHIWEHFSTGKKRVYLLEAWENHGQGEPKNLLRYGLKEEKPSSTSRFTEGNLTRWNLTVPHLRGHSLPSSNGPLHPEAILAVTRPNTQYRI